MRIICLLFFLLSGCSFLPSPSQDISYWKPLLIEMDDITLLKLTDTPTGAILRNKERFISKKKDDVTPFYDYLFGDHFKKAHKKGFQTWEYVIYFHRNEGDFREHKIHVSSEGISYEGVFYPFRSKKDKEQLFSLLEERLS